MSQKCVHKGCGKKFTDVDEDCIYHPGPPIFHEGQKGWKCCKPRVLTFDEFLSIPPCTTGKHSTVDDTPAPEPSTKPSTDADPPAPKPISQPLPAPTPAQPLPAQQAPPPPADPPSSDSDSPDTPIPPNSTCRRRACGYTSPSSPISSSRDQEEETCIYHPGQPIFHEGSKGWTCCKRRVLEFDEFMRIPGCKTRGRHLFVGKKKKRGGEGGEEEEKVENVRHDFYQTPTTLIASLYLKKIDKSRASISFPTPTTIALDLPTTDHKRYQTSLPLYGAIDVEKSSWRILGTKVELNLVKGEGEGGRSWPVLRADEKATGSILQVGRAGRA